MGAAYAGSGPRRARAKRCRARRCRAAGDDEPCICELAHGPQLDAGRATNATGAPTRGAE
eukprot:5444508-Alexandrium_andersonii.AAC.1